MSDVGVIITTLGALLLLGMLGDVLARKVGLPRVTLLLLFGVGLCSSGLDLLPHSAEE